MESITRMLKEKNMEPSSSRFIKVADISAQSATSTDVAGSNSPKLSSPGPEMIPESDVLKIQNLAACVGSPASRGPDDSGNFSEITDTADSPSSPRTTNLTLNRNGGSIIEQIPYFAIGSPCLATSRTSITNLLNCEIPNCTSVSVTAVSSCSSVQDMRLQTPGGSEVSGGFSLPSIKLNCCNDSPNESENVNIHRSDSYLGLLAENFNAFYQQKMIDIDREAGGDQGAVVLKRNSVLKDWINDLVEQNQVLIETVDEMEREAAEKIIHLDGKVFQSSQMAAKHMTIIQEYEQQVQHLLAQRGSLEEETGELRAAVAVLKNTGGIFEEKLNSLESENEKLVVLLTRIRDWGVWDISDLHLTERTYYRLFGLYPNLAGSEVQTVFTRERAREVHETEKQLNELKVTLQDLQNYKVHSEESLNEKENLLSDIRSDRDQLREALRMYMDENAEYKRSLEDTQHLLASFSMRSGVSSPRTTYSNQNSCSTNFQEKDDEMSEMLRELRDLRNQLSLACTERQNAVTEANALKCEMNEHIEEVQHMKNLLVNIQNEAQNTRAKVQDVQDKQDQLVSLKGQVYTYQQKYEEARDMLNSKSDTIQNLQLQMDLLQEKVLKIDKRKSRNRFDTTSTQQDGQLESSGRRKRNSKINRPSQELIEMEIDLEKNRPPWNEYFIKGSLEDQDPIFVSDGITGRKYENQNLLVRKSSMTLAKEKQERVRQKALKYDFMEKHKKMNARLLEQKKSATHQKEILQKCMKEPIYEGSISPRPSCISTNSAQHSGKTFSSQEASERYQKVAKYFSNRFGIDLDGNTSGRSSEIGQPPQKQRVKLPPIQPLAKDRKLHSRGSGSKRSGPEKKYHDRLPRLVEKPQEKKENISYPGSGCKTLDALVSEAVRASKQMIESFDPSNGNMSMRVRASHRHHRRALEEGQGHHQDKETSRIRDFTQGQKPHAEIPLKTLYKAEERKTKHIEIVRDGKRRSGGCHYKVKKSDSETDPSFTAMQHKKQSRPNTATCLLAALPADSQEYLVKNWIKNVSSTTLIGENSEVDVAPVKSKINMSTTRVGVKHQHHQNLSITRSKANHSQPHKDCRSGKKSLSQQSVKVKSEQVGRSLNQTILKAKTKPDEENNRLYYSTHNGPLNNNTETIPGLNYEVSFLDPSKGDYRLQGLQDRISSLESRCATKDTLIASLQCELEAEKLAKDNSSRSMDSKDAEIIMQKDRSHETNSSRYGRNDVPLQECILRSYNEILKQEEELMYLKSESESLALRTELLEKNVLLHKSYVILGIIEPDYSQGDFKTELRSNNDYSGDGDIAEFDYFLPKEIAELKASQAENRQLKTRLDEELANIRRLQKDLDGMASTKFAEMSLMATELEGFIFDLKAENVILKSELNELEERGLHGPAPCGKPDKDDISILTNKIEKCLIDLSDKDEQIRIRNEQIARYEEYVSKLHKELKAWANSSEDLHTDQFPIQHNMDKYHDSQTQTQPTMNVATDVEIEQINQHMKKSQRREAQLRCDNQMLRQIVSTLSLKIEELVKSFEFIHFEPDHDQGDHPQCLNSVAVPSDYQIPLLASTPIKENKQSIGPFPADRPIAGPSRHSEFNSTCPMSPVFPGDNQNPKGISYACLMNSIRDLNNQSQEKRLQNIEELMEQIKSYVTH